MSFKALNNCACIVGNSSSGIREGALLGVPCVNIGSRQLGRERSDNVVDVGYNVEEIFKSIKSQIKHGRCKSSYIFGDGSSGQKIADLLSTVELSILKKLHY